MAVSTIASYDVYKEYINPRASNKQLMRVNHGVVIFWVSPILFVEILKLIYTAYQAVFMSGFSSVWHHIGLDLNFLVRTCQTLSIICANMLQLWASSISWVWPPLEPSSQLV